MSKSDEPVEFFPAHELQGVEEAMQVYKRILLETDWVKLGKPEIEDFKQSLKWFT